MRKQENGYQESEYGYAMCRRRQARGVMFTSPRRCGISRILRRSSAPRFALIHWSDFPIFHELFLINEGF
jgi:hypothetical protein